MAVDQGRAISIHRHLAGVGAFITGVVGGLFLLILLGFLFSPRAIKCWIAILPWQRYWRRT